MNQFLLVGEVSHELRVCESTVRMLERSGRLPALRTKTGVRLFAAEDVRRLKVERNAEKRQSRQD